jgi:uncharacterized RDD family membrane protein YckC
VSDPEHSADVPVWRRELSRRLHEIKLKREAASPQLQATASATLPFPDSQERTDSHAPLRRAAAARLQRKPRAVSGAHRTAELQAVPPIEERRAELPLFPSAEGEAPPGLIPASEAAPKSQAVPAPEIRRFAAAESPRAAPPGEIKDLIDSAIVAVRAPADRPPVSLPRLEAPAADRLVVLSRTLSGLIDLSIVFLSGTSFVLAAELVSGIAIFDARSWLNYALLLAAVYFVYSTFFLKTASQTIGMMVTDLRVLDRARRRPHTVQILTRTVVFLPSLLGLGAGLICSLFDREARCLHDTLSGTRVSRLN